MQSDSDVILGCPFCLSDPKIEEVQYREEGEKSFKTSWKIRCGNFYGCVFKPQAKMSDREMLISLWNTRDVDIETGEVDEKQVSGSVGSEQAAVGPAG